MKTEAQVKPAERSPCPTAERLAELLTDRLDGSEREALEAHLGQCSSCQHALEQGGHSRGAWERWGQLLKEQEQHQGERTLLGSLSRPVQGSPGDQATSFEPSPDGPVSWPTIPGCEILQELGRGGMGVVYKARQISLDRTVAVKVILAGAHASPESLDRFRGEAQVLARLQHPHIVQIHEVGEQNGLPYFVMEFVDGNSLARRLRGSPCPPAPAAKLLELLARAIHAAHQQGIIHRDLKPANILLKEEGGRTMDGPDHRVPSVALVPAPGECTPKITDFGLAKQLGAGAGLTQTGQLMGTPSYMAPEQARGQSQQIGPAVDVYALGATLYELLTGRPPFVGTTALETIQQVLAVEPVPPTRLQPQTPRDLETVCLKCLEKLPSQRYASAAALAEDLRRFQAGEPIRARRTSPARRLLKWARRRPALAALTAATSAALAALFVLWLQFTAHLRSLNTDLQEQRDHASQAEADAKAVLDFFEEKLLAAGRPEGQQGGLGADVTLRKAVDAAEQAVAGAFQDRPPVEASIRNKLGLTYQYLGDYAQAIRQHDRALALRRAQLSPDHSDVLCSMTNLAAAHWKLNQMDLAMPLLQEVMERSRAKLGSTHDDTLRAMNNLGLAFRDAGQLEQSCRLLEESLTLHRDKYGNGHELTLSSMNNYAVACFAAGKLESAFSLWQEAVQQRQVLLGAEHPETLQALHNLAVAHAQAGKLDTALPLLEQALKLRRGRLGADHPDTLTTLNSLAGTYLAASRPEQALPHYEEVCRLRKVKLGQDHPSTVKSLFHLAHTYRAAGRLTSAVSVYEEVLAQQRTKPGPDHPETLLTADSLAAAYMQAQKPDKAVPLLRECLAIREKKQPDAWRTFHARSLLGAALLAQKDYAEAETLLLAGYEGMRRQEARMPASAKARLTEALELLVRLYDASDNKAESEKWRRVLESRMQESGSGKPKPTRRGQGAGGGSSAGLLPSTAAPRPGGPDPC